jgi:hypothetical protein
MFRRKNTFSANIAIVSARKNNFFSKKLGKIFSPSNILEFFFNKQGLF